MHFKTCVPSGTDNQKTLRVLNSLGELRATKVTHNLVSIPSPNSFRCVQIGGTYLFLKKLSSSTIVMLLF